MATCKHTIRREIRVLYIFRFIINNRSRGINPPPLVGLVRSSPYHGLKGFHCCIISYWSVLCPIQLRIYSYVRMDAYSTVGLIRQRYSFRYEMSPWYNVANKNIYLKNCSCRIATWPFVLVKFFMEPVLIWRRYLIFLSIFCYYLNIFSFF
jgi:hypothetical protein